MDALEIRGILGEVSTRGLGFWEGGTFLQGFDDFWKFWVLRVLGLWGFACFVVN